jgi:hypothetical protein
VFLCLLLLLADGVRAASDCRPESLPPRVAEMRQAILNAARQRKIEALREPIEWNELKPDIGVAGDDPIAHLKAMSGDGTGESLLARVEAILQTDCKAPAAGSEAASFVWPRFADAHLGKLGAEDEALLAKLASPEEIKAMRAAGRWTGWRIAIGRDGTWHSLRKGE